MKRIILVNILASLVFIAKPQGCVEPSSEEGVSVFGFFQPQFDYKMSDEPQASFRFNRMRMGVIGNIPYDFSYYGLLETSPFVNGEGQIHLLDAFVTYSRFKNLKISVGSFKKPFGAELSQPCSNLYTIERSQFVNELTGPTNRDLGLMILGGSDSTLFSYRVAVMNGTGLGQVDNNTFKDVYGQLMIKPIPQLKVGLNAMYGEDPSTTLVGEKDKRMRYGVDMQLNYNNIMVISEYIKSDDRGTYTTGGGCDGTPVTVHQGSVERDGFYVLAGYRAFGNWMPVIRYEQYDKNKGESGINVQAITYGINYYFNDWTRLQVNYCYRAEDPLEVKNDAILVQIQVKF